VTRESREPTSGQPDAQGDAGSWWAALFGAPRGSRTRVTSSGSLVIWVTGVGAFVLLIVATIYHLHQIFVMAAVVGALLPVSSFISRRSLAALEAHITSAPRGTLHEGRVATIGARLANTGRLPKCFCSFRPAYPEGLQPVGEQDHLGSLLGGESVDIDSDFVAVARGVYRIKEACLETTDLLGIFEFTRTIPDFRLELVVYPEVYPLGRFDLSGAWHWGEAGTPSRTRAGESVEFYGVREYRSGDEPRRIHWPTTARTGRLSVMEFEDIPARGLVVITDCELGTDLGSRGLSTLDCAARAAASLAALACQEGAPFNLVAAGAEDCSARLPAGSRSATPVFEALARMRADGGSGIDGVCAAAAQRLGTSGSVFLLTSRSDATLVGAVTVLLAAGAAPTVLIFRPTSARDGGAMASLAIRGVKVMDIYCHDPLGPQLGAAVRG